MENKETLEGDTLIAKFMGWEDASLEYKIKWCGVKTKERLQKLDIEVVPYLVNPKETEPLFIDSLEYHSAWDWLMPVVKKIKQLPIDEFDKKKPVMSSLMSVDIEELWKSVIVFIKWYNKNGK